MSDRGRIITGQPVSEAIIRRARELRANMTPVETMLWEHLRANRLINAHFRRQQIVAGYIVDFYCHVARLAVEIDGPIHDAQPERDAERDRVIANCGLTVLRFTNTQVETDLDNVLREIAAYLVSGTRQG